MSDYISNEAIERIVDRALDRAFEEIERDREGKPPSAVMRTLEDYYGLGDAWAEWWETGEGEWF